MPASTANFNIAINAKDNASPVLGNVNKSATGLTSTLTRAAGRGFGAFALGAAKIAIPFMGARAAIHGLRNGLQKLEASEKVSASWEKLKHALMEPINPVLNAALTKLAGLLESLIPTAQIFGNRIRAIADVIRAGVQKDQLGTAIFESVVYGFGGGISTQITALGEDLQWLLKSFAAGLIAALRTGIDAITPGKKANYVKTFQGISASWGLQDTNGNITINREASDIVEKFFNKQWTKTKKDFGVVEKVGGSPLPQPASETAATPSQPRRVPHAARLIKEGQPVHCLDNPLGEEKYSGTYTGGNIGNLNSLHADKPMIQMSNPISPGNSGGPLVDDSGRVIGIVVAKDTRATHINFAVPVNELKRMLEDTK